MALHPPIIKKRKFAVRYISIIRKLTFKWNEEQTNVIDDLQQLIKTIGILQQVLIFNFNKDVNNILTKN